MPLADLPSSCVSVKPAAISVNRLERILRNGRPPVIGRIEAERFVMDVRTIRDEDVAIVVDVMQDALLKGEG